MRDEETLEEEEEKGGRRLLMCECVVVVYLFQRGRWEGRQDALAPIRARGQGRGRPVPFFARTLPSIRFLTRTVCLSFHG